jgi:polar amino acid transport system ATP-binding protein
MLKRRPVSTIEPPASADHPGGSRLMVDVQDLHHSYGAIEVLRGVDLRVEPGGVCCILGPSGSGKSTLLRCISLLEIPLDGDIIVDGALLGFRRENSKLYRLREREICRQRERIGMVFQRFDLFRHLTALQNVMVGPVEVRGTPKRAAAERARQLLARVGLSDRADHYPSQLSGGQQQRVAIARALSMDPRVMLFDEPTSALDPELVGEVLEVMRALSREGMTMIVVTHEVGFAREVAHQAVFMDYGRIVEHGPPSQVLDNPRNERTRAFLSQVI